MRGMSGPGFCAGALVEQRTEAAPYAQKAEGSQSEAPQPQLDEHIDPGLGRVVGVVQHVHCFVFGEVARAGGGEMADFTGSSGELDHGIIAVPAFGRPSFKTHHGAWDLL